MKKKAICIIIFLISLPMVCPAQQLQGLWHKEERMHDIYFSFHGNRFVYMVLRRFSEGNSQPLIPSCCAGTFRTENGLLILDRKAVYLGGRGWVTFAEFGKREPAEKAVMRDKYDLVGDSLEYWFNNSYRMVLHKAGLTTTQRQQIFRIDQANGLLAGSFPD